MAKATATTRTATELAQMKSARAEQLARFIRMLESDIEDRHRYDWYHVMDADGNRTEEITEEEQMNIEIFKALQDELLAMM